MEALPSADSKTYSLEEYEGWWSRAEELNRYIQKIPVSLAESVKMDSKQTRILEDYMELDPPYVFEELGYTEDDDVGALLSWIKEAETFIYYMMNVRQREGSANKSSSRVEPIESVHEAYGVSDQWRWPWISKWHEDPDGQRSSMEERSEERQKISKVLIGGAVAIGGVYMFMKYLEED